MKKRKKKTSRSKMTLPADVRKSFHLTLDELYELLERALELPDSWCVVSTKDEPSGIRITVEGQEDIRI